MILSDWINSIRWKYFTNNKSGLIFKELMKEFWMVEQMTEKRYLNIIPSGIQDTETGKIIHGSKIGDLLNEQDERIKELETELVDTTQRFEYELKMKLKYHLKLIECEKR